MGYQSSIIAPTHRVKDTQDSSVGINQDIVFALFPFDRFLIGTIYQKLVEEYRGKCHVFFHSICSFFSKNRVLLCRSVQNIPCMFHLSEQLSHRWKLGIMLKNDAVHKTS